MAIMTIEYATRTMPMIARTLGMILMLEDMTSINATVTLYGRASNDHVDTAEKASRAKAPRTPKPWAMGMLQS